MGTWTATDASRGFSDLLDAVERGETVIVTRGGHRVAEIRPAPRRTGRDLRATLESRPSLLDDDFSTGIDDVVTPYEGDPWGAA